jgi:hypothetical protein
MSDTFRKTYHTMKQENTDKVIAIKQACEAVEALMKTVTSREMSIALTNLEQASMWATKAVVLSDAREGEANS